MILIMIMNRYICRIGILCWLIILWYFPVNNCFAVCFENDPPLISSKVALRIALDRLREEGRIFRDTGKTQREKPDFADDFTYRERISTDDVLEAVCSIQDKQDIVVDGYVRWQLLSLNPDLNLLDDYNFEQLVANLPGLEKHPGMDPLLHEELELLAQQCEGNKSAVNLLGERWRELENRIKAIELLNYPALMFRKQVIENMPDEGPRGLTILFYDVRDRIAAGSETRWIKTRITVQLKKRKLDETVTLDQRYALIKLLETFAKQETRIIRTITIYNDEQVKAKISYSTLAIRASDLTKWSAYLNRHDPVG